MDDAVMRAGVLLAAAMLLACGAAQAEQLRDPTRPPARLFLARGAAPAAAASAAPQLQSVLIGRGAGGRHVAVIDGETVRLGDRFRGARVVRMTPTEVELLRGRERQVLKLAGAEAASPAVAVGKR